MHRPHHYLSVFIGISTYWLLGSCTAEKADPALDAVDRTDTGETTQDSRDDLYQDPTDGLDAQDTGETDAHPPGDLDTATPPHVCGNGILEDDEVCDDGKNDGTYGGCAVDCTAFAPHCGDGELSDDEACDDGVNDGSLESCSADCLAEGPRCGDGLASGDEVCDDGKNDASYDSCAADCLSFGPYCGDGEVTHDEACDDGENDGAYGGCQVDCLALGPHCGDGIRDAHELCDDGINDGRYGTCEPGCTLMAAHCGDGQVNGQEVCDDGINDGRYGGCTSGCAALASHCGDGIVNAPDESCDDGENNGNYGTCNTACTGLGPHCGDSQVNGQEVCDDGINDGRYGGCKAGCQALGPRCGDGIENGDETCDNGTNNGNYGKCNTTCTGSSGFCGDGTVNGPETCDDGDDNATYGHCNRNCSGLFDHCGDGQRQGPETCDDGDDNGAYGMCRADCSGLGPSCGDGVVNGPEVCDDGNTKNDDDCTNNCTLPAFTVGFNLPTPPAPVRVDKRIVLTFSRSIKPNTITPANVSIKQNGTPVDIRFMVHEKEVQILAPNWLINTTYTITITSGVKDSLNNSFSGPVTRTFSTNAIDAVGQAIVYFDPLGGGDKQLIGASTDFYSPISAPSEYVLLGIGSSYDRFTPGVMVYDQPTMNRFPNAENQALLANPILWNPISTEPGGGGLYRTEMNGTDKRAVRARLDNDIRDEVAVLFSTNRYNPIGMQIFNPAKAARGTTYGSTTINGIGRDGIAKVFDLAAGQYDDDPQDELFVLVGEGDINGSSAPSFSGKLMLYIYDDALSTPPYKHLATMTLAEHSGFSILGVSLDVGDVDRDGRDDVAVMYNVSAANPYSIVTLSQETRALLFKRQATGAGFDKITLIDQNSMWADPGSNGVTTPPMPSQSRDPKSVLMLKAAIVDVDDNPNQREIVLGLLEGPLAMTRWVLQYNPTATHKLNILVNRDIVNDGFLVNDNENYRPHPDKVFLPLTLGATPQKSILFMNGNIQRLNKSVGNGGYVYSFEAITRDPSLAFNPKNFVITAGEIKPLTYNAQNQPIEKGRADEIARLVQVEGGDGYALKVVTLNEVVNNEGVITDYYVNNLPNVPRVPAGTDAYQPLLVLADFDHDGIYGKFINHTTKLSGNHIIAVISAPPCREEMGGCESTYAFGQKNRDGNVISGSLGVGASAGVHLLTDATGSFVVGAGVTIAELDVNLKVGITAGFTYTNTREFGSAIAYTTSRAHAVVFSTTPYDIFNYNIVQHPNPLLEPDDGTATSAIDIAIPGIPTIYSVSMDAYKTQSPAELTKIEGVLASTPGQLESYSKLAQFETWKSTRDVGVVNLTTDDVRTTFVNPVGYNESWITPQLSVESTNGVDLSVEIEAETEIRGCTVSICAGATFTATAGYAFSYSFADEVTFSSKISNVLSAADAYQVLLTPYRLKRTLDGGIEQDFLVLDYLVGLD